MSSPFVTLWELRPSDDGHTVRHVASVPSLDDYYGRSIRDLVIKRAPRGCHVLVVRGDVLGCFVGRGNAEPTDTSNDAGDE